MHLQCVDSIEDIDASLWNSLISETDPLHSHSFLRGLEKARVEDSDQRYVLAWEGKELRGSAVLSTFRISLDLFIGEAAWVQWLTKRWPSFFEITILFCGTPISSGHRNFYVKQREDIPAFLELLNQEIDRQCKVQGVKLCCFKEFLPEEAALLEPELTKYGWFRGESLPYVRMPLRWESFAAYAHSMRSNYRRQLNLGLRKLGRKAPPFIDQDSESSSTGFRLLSPEEMPPARFFELYLSVMSRAEVKLETLNLAFFEQFYAEMGPRLRILGMLHQEEILSVALLIDEGDILNFLWTGKDSATDPEHDNYVNLLAAIVAFAIREGYTELKMGQTAYYTKMRLGGTPFPLSIYFKSQAPVQHAILKSLRKVLFPLTPLPEMRVFRDGSAGSGNKGIRE